MDVSENLNQKTMQQICLPESSIASVPENLEATCWGCGSRLVLPSYSPIFKCGWCGAITNSSKKIRKHDSACFSHWRRVRDSFFVIILFIFMSFVICAGVWAVYPIVFSISYICGVFHCTVAVVLATSTLSTFCLAAFLPAGGPPNVVWGSYPAVNKGGLENYTFCAYCAKPKCPRAHHCRSCKKCILDMDHHCPFIGNCVGATNHKHFISFLISVVVSCTYVVSMATYAFFHTWPDLKYGPIASSLTLSNGFGATLLLKEIVSALASSLFLLSTRSLILVYLAMACFSVGIGISVLLWQQLFFIYQGKTYISQLSSGADEPGERGCQNILRFFNCPYLVFRWLLGTSNGGKTLETPYSKIL